MDYSMTLRWNEKVQPNDLVFHLGDFVWKQQRKYVDHILSRLNGTVILIKGSHDKATDGRIPTVPYMLMRIGEFKCLLNHQPCFPKGHPNEEYSDTRIPKEILSKVDFILSAHVHNRWLWNWKNYNVGVDQHEFYPISLEDVERELSNHAVS